MTIRITKAAVALAALLAFPALAQTPPTTAPAVSAAPAISATPRAENQGMRKGMHGMFGNMSAEGRKTMMETMRGAADQNQAAQLKAARDRVNQLVSAERLDPAALARSMDDERKLVDAFHVRRQQALIVALQKLSVEDRKAFAAASQMGRQRMSDMMRQRGNHNRGQGHQSPAKPAN